MRGAALAQKTGLPRLSDRRMWLEQMFRRLFKGERELEGRGLGYQAKEPGLKGTSVRKPGKVCLVFVSLRQSLSM